MKTSRFNRIIVDVAKMNSHQNRILKEKLKAIDKEKEVANNLETHFDKLLCPHCGADKKVRWGKRQDLQRYKCKSCHKTFNSLTNTPLARLRKKECWLEYAQCLKEGKSVRKSASDCVIHRNTAFKWRHRFLKNSTKIKPKSLTGIVETQEKMILKSEKGSRNLHRPPRQRGQRIDLKKIPAREKLCLIFSRDRHQNTLSKMLLKFTSSEMETHLKPTLAKDALFCSNSKNTYRYFARENSLRHGFIDFTKGEMVKKDIVHLRNVSSYKASYESWARRFHGVATKYLHNYLSWYSNMDEFNMDINKQAILLRAKNPSPYKVQPLFRT